MADFLIYDLKVAVLIAVFYFCYRLLMERDTLHHQNRMVLLTAIGLSLVLPLCVVTLHETVWVEAPLSFPEGDTIVQQTFKAPSGAVRAADALWATALGGVVAVGAVGRLLYLLLSYLKLRRMLRGGEQLTLDGGLRLVIVDQPVASFTWQNIIVVNRQDYEEHNPLLLIHERSHVRLHHSRDIVFVELITALQWFNPVVWLLRRDLRTVHEFEADEAVLSRGADTAQYISLLMQKATGIQACVLANGINNSETKKRIDMMIKKKSHPLCRLKGLYVLAVAAATMTLTAKTVTDYRTLPTDKKAETPTPTTTVVAPQQKAVKHYEPLAQKKPEKKKEVKPEIDVVFDICENMPQFPGGDAEMMKFIARNIRYPLVAEQWGVQGRVVVTFVVEKDGSITSPQVVKTTGLEVQSDTVTVVGMKHMTEEQRKEAEAQDTGIKAGAQAIKDEAVRVVKQMPKWQPGKQNGSVVRCKYSIPLTFRLS